MNISRALRSFSSTLHRRIAESVAEDERAARLALKPGYFATQKMTDELSLVFLCVIFAMFHMPVSLLMTDCMYAISLQGGPKKSKPLNSRP